MILQDKWIEDYLIECDEGKNLSYHSLKAYKIDLLLFKSKMAEFEMDMNKDSLKAYIVFLSQNYKPKSAKRKLASVKGFMHHLLFEDLVETNPLDRVKYSFNEPKTLPKVIDVECISNINKLILNNYMFSHTQYQKTLHLRDMLIIDLLISTGIRVSELCSIKYSNINFNNNTILIEGKGKKERLVYIGANTTMDNIHQYIEQKSLFKYESSYIFLSMKGNPLDSNSIRYLLKKYSKYIGINKHITPHQFRHTFATSLLEEDVDIRIIQKILGHSSINTTAIYLDVAQEKIRQVMISKNPRNKL